jgi:signal transduction histidine kinase
MTGAGDRRRRLLSLVRSNKAVVLAGGLCAATAMLVWLGYRATQEARHSTRLLLERRIVEQLALLSVGLAQDMRGAHATVLIPVTPSQLMLDPPYDLAEAFARGFARFPYPEFFFTWNDWNGEDATTHLFMRADRHPVWHALERLGGPYPVNVVRNPAAMVELVAVARQRARTDRPVALFDATIAGVPYHIVVNVLYGERGQVSGLVGFGVNLPWMREFYFDELTFQLGRIGGGDQMSLEILDGDRQIVTSTRPRHPGIPPAERQFSLVFVDRAFLGMLSPQESGSFESWTMRVGVATDNPMVTAAGSADGTFILISLAALATVSGLVVAVRGVKVAAELAAMKSDFVSSVTHELKTPLAVIRLVADTLARGRYDSPQTVGDYAGLLSRETWNLSQLIDNLLAYARLSDVKQAYLFDAVDLGELVEETLERFHSLLAGQFTVHVEVPSTLPPVRADRLAATQMLDNILDNAIKYSDQVRIIEIHARRVDDRAAITVADHGIGIRADEIGRVTDKFFRGRDAKRGGSGLGLAIVRQIADAHHGELRIHSQPGRGTRVEIILPLAATDP